jgi:hypothetical protein
MFITGFIVNGAIMKTTDYKYLVRLAAFEEHGYNAAALLDKYYLIRLNAYRTLG